MVGADIGKCDQTHVIPPSGTCDLHEVLLSVLAARLVIKNPIRSTHTSIELAI